MRIFAVFNRLNEVLYDIFQFFSRFAEIKHLFKRILNVLSPWGLLLKELLVAINSTLI
jgi:hypothetical protein